jgi:hypothetical protein
MQGIKHDKTKKSGHAGRIIEILIGACPKLLELAPTEPDGLLKVEDRRKFPLWRIGVQNFCPLNGKMLIEVRKGVTRVASKN